MVSHLDQTTQVDAQHHDGPGCRCLPCRAALARTRSAYRRHPSPLVPVDGLLVARLCLWRSRGIGIAQIARVSGLHWMTVDRLVKGRLSHVRRRTRDALEQARPILAPHALVPADEALAIIDALVADGYTREGIARALGQAGTGGDLWPRPTCERVTAQTAARLRALRARYLDEG